MPPRDAAYVGHHSTGYKFMAHFPTLQSCLSLFFQGPRGAICGMETSSPRVGLPGYVGRAMVVQCSVGGPAEVRGAGGGVCVSRVTGLAGGEARFEPKVLPSPLCKTQVVSASGQATGMGHSSETWTQSFLGVTLGHSHTVASASHVTSLL